MPGRCGDWPRTGQAAGSDAEFEEIYQKGLAAGSDPNGEEYWLKCRDFDQKFVEMAAIAYAILMAPDKVWDPLSEKEKDHLTAWLDEINHYECSYNNWQFFCILVNVALKSQGRPYSQERIDLGLKRIDSYYVGDGWYYDGGNGQKDYYIAFAIHFYSIIYTMFMEDAIRSTVPFSASAPGNLPSSSSTGLMRMAAPFPMAVPRRIGLPRFPSFPSVPRRSWKFFLCR